MAVTGYIYLHRSPSDKCYVGQTTMNPPSLRWSSKDAYRANGYFTAAIQKHGWENFAHEILAEVVADTKELLIEKLNELEPIYMQQYNTLIPNGYNIQPGGYNAPCADETKQKIREKLKGRPRSDESIERQKVAQLGRKVSQETRDKLRAIHTGRVMSPEACEKMRQAAMGNTRRLGTTTSEQGLANIRAGAKNRLPMSEETKLKIGLGNSGKVVSAEARARISEGRKGIKFSDEHRKHLKENSGNRGKRCITDGVLNKYISMTDSIPAGWRLGVARRSKV
jgi:group I intron endonuclease